MRPTAFPLVALAGLLSALLAGCNGQAAADSADAPQLGSVSGVIVDQAIRPLAGALVSAGALQATTGADGAFVFTDVAPGALLLTASLAGYADAQAVVQVVPGTPATASLSLHSIPTAQPYHTTLSFEAFHNLGLGVATSVADRVANETGTVCTCRFPFVPDADLRALLVEAVWQDSVPSPARPTSFTVVLDADNRTAQFSGTQPLYHEVQPLEFGGDVSFRLAAVQEFTLSLYTDAAWPAAGQGADVFVTLWYGEPMPSGWSFVEGSA